MPVDPKTIQKGQCYRTAGDQYRRVYAVDDDHVTYESWGGNKGNHDKGPLSRDRASRQQFAMKVEAEIPCPNGMKPLP